MTLPTGDAPPPSVTARRNGDATKARILAAAEAEFAAKGFDGARLGAIARAVGVQQALIHHYFEDKERLYEEVLARGLSAVTAEGWGVLEQLGPPSVRGGDKGGAAGKTKGKGERERLGRREVTQLTEAFVDVLVRFYATHAALLSIVRHDLEAPGEERAKSAVAEVVKKSSMPVFREVVRRIDDLKQAGAIRADVDALHLCVSTMAMACFPYQEARLLATLWPVDWRSEATLQARKREIVATVLARVLP